mmetsp:Transcript_25884/g.65255  ORF Transcript_25884/g.65255 Transcript_25884/m.65255 type:complete len:233 (-) Transcript_25884:75-773(-)
MTLDASRSLQRIFASKTKCFGCGPGNPVGLQLASFITTPDRHKYPHASGGLLVESVFLPEAEKHCGPPGFLYGGISASLLDCQSCWVAAVHRSLFGADSRDDASSLHIPDSARSGPGDAESFHEATLKRINFSKFRLPVTGKLEVEYKKPVPLSAATIGEASSEAPGTTFVGPITVRAWVNNVEGYRKYYVQGEIFCSSADPDKGIGPAVKSAAIIVYPRQAPTSRDEAARL